MGRSKTNAASRRVRAASAGVLCLLVRLLFAPGLHAQSPDEHASHHPAAAGTGAMPTTPGAPTPMAAPTPAGGGMMEQMGAMMKGMMGGPPQKEFYPSLMALPTVPPEQRLKLQQQAEARAKIGAALLQQGTARIANPNTNATELQAGAADVRAGLKEWESGQAARRALAEGRPPRAIALQWFQTEMDLTAPAAHDESTTPLGVTLFHLFTMALLIAFALAMVAMYYFKMRRAAALFGRIESKPGLPVPGEAPPLAGTPPPPHGTPAGGEAPPSAPAPPLPVVAPDEQSSTTVPPPATPAEPEGDAIENVARATEPGHAGGQLTASPETHKLPAEKELDIAPLTANWRGYLRVGEVITESPNVKTFRLLPPPDERFLPFTFVPGQFLNVAFFIGGARMNRSYSISSSPTEREYVEISVRREPRGAVSRHMDDLLKVGDLVEAGGPVGKFTFDGTEADSIVLISGGVGITPMMSISRYLTERSWPGEIFFIYSCRTPADILFADELADLQRRNPNLHVSITVSKPEGTDWTGARGRITKEWLTQTVPDLASRRTHMCGPPAMMDTIKAIFTELGIPLDHLKMEAFGAVKPTVAAPGTATPTGPATGPLVMFSKNNKTAKIHADQTILELSEELGIGIEFSCRVGTCGICKVKMTSGEVDQEVQDALTEDDKKNGIILACQAKPKSEVTVEA